MYGFTEKALTPIPISLSVAEWTVITAVMSGLDLSEEGTRIFFNAMKSVGEQLDSAIIKLGE